MDKTLLLDLTIRLGRTKVVLIITFLAVLLSIISTTLIFYYLDRPMPIINQYLSIIIPAILASIGSWHTVGMILTIHHLEEKVRQLADYDSLTSVMARRTFLNVSESSYQLMDRKGMPFAILYMDIDDFKKKNDTYTHAGGDAVLVSLGRILLEQIRKSDIVGRLGGEEFAISLPETDINGALHFAEKVRKTIENNSVDYSNKIIHYTVSIGVSVFDEKNRSEFNDLIAQADKALYSAKNSGKNRVVSWDKLQGSNLSI